MNYKKLCESTPRFEIETKTGENKTVLQWKDVPYADGYRVFCSKHKKNYFVGIDNTEKPRFVVTDLKNGEPLDYKVKAHRIADGPDNYFGESVIVTTCPLETPSDLKASVDKDGNIVLNWNGIRSCDGYKVYISQKGSDSYKFLCYSYNHTCIIPAMEKKGTYCFKVRAFVVIDRSEKLSNSTNEAELHLEKVIKKNKAKALKRTALTSELNTRFKVSSNTLENANASCLIIIGGDIVAGEKVQQEAMDIGNNFDFLMASLEGIPSSFDFTVACLDTDLDDTRPYTTEFSDEINCPSYILSSLVKGGIDALAVNSDTVKKIPSPLRDSKMPYFGKNSSFIGNNGYSTASINGIKVAFISTALGSEVKSIVADAKSEGCEYIISFCSWKEKHIPYVKDSWRAYARKLADSGVDYIVGMGLNTLCEYDIIKAQDNREVPVAYSLGCLAGGSFSTLYEQMSAFICLRLKRGANGIVTRDFDAYIPVVTPLNTGTVRPVLLSGKKSILLSEREIEKFKNKIADTLTDKISPARDNVRHAHHSFMLNGSSLVAGSFGDNGEVTTDRTHLFISQFAITGSKLKVEERYYRDDVAPLYWNLTKDFDNYCKENKSEYLILDLYYAACSPLYKMGDTLYSGGKAFIQSEFFKENRKKLSKVDISKNGLWKKLLDEYKKVIKKHYSSKNIILIRITGPGVYINEGNIFKYTDSTLDEKLLREMEKHFILSVNPAVITYSDCYPGVMNKRGSCYAINRDRRFSENIAKSVLSYVNNKPSSYNYLAVADKKLWLPMIAENFEAIYKSGMRSEFFRMNNGVEYFISRTSGGFVCSNFNDILALLKGGYSTLAEVEEKFDFGENAVLKTVFKAVKSIKNGNFENPCVDKIVNSDLAVCDDLALCLANYFDNSGIIENCRLNRNDIKFYLSAARLCSAGPHKQQANILVQEYYKKHRPMVIDVWGGFNVDRIVKLCKNSVPGKVFSDCNIFTAFEKPVDIDLSYADRSSAIHKELSRNYAYKKGGFNDYILVDFNEVIKTLYKHKNVLFAAVSGCTGTKIFKEFCGDDQMIIPYKAKGGISKTAVKNSVIRFAEFLKEQYGNNIILSRFELNSLYLDINDKIKSFSDDFIDDKNKLIKYCEEEFIKATDCYIINYCDKYIGRQGGMTGPEFTAAYEDMFYIDSANAVDSIASGYSEKEYQKLDILSYIERSVKITEANPDMEYSLKKLVFGDSSQLF